MRIFMRGSDSGSMSSPRVNVPFPNTTRGRIAIRHRQRKKLARASTGLRMVHRCCMERWLTWSAGYRAHKMPATTQFLLPKLRMWSFATAIPYSSSKRTTTLSEAKFRELLLHAQTVHHFLVRRPKRCEIVFWRDKDQIQVSSAWARKQHDPVMFSQRLPVLLDRRIAQEIDGSAGNTVD